jgi:hypothetical protein
MLFFPLASILLVVGAQVVAAADDQPEFIPPGVLAFGETPGTPLRPYVGKPVQVDNAVDDTKVIRGLLARSIKRQSCPSGYGVCNDGAWVPFCSQCSWFVSLISTLSE